MLRRGWGRGGMLTSFKQFLEESGEDVKEYMKSCPVWEIYEEWIVNNERNEENLSKRAKLLAK